MSNSLNIRFDNSYHRELEGFYVPWQGEQAPAASVIQLNHGLATELGMDFSNLDQEFAAMMFSGSDMFPGAAPLAQVYAGHQFGSFNPQLGDGRAMLLGEVVDTQGRRRDIQLKGSGRTPFSRGGDGKSALGPVLREYLVSEAMHALGVPTTRALAAVMTGERVRRETSLPGAILTRVASSHIRVGTFEFFSSRQETEKVRQLADYAISRHYADLVNAEDCYLHFLNAVCQAQAALVAKWMLLGFIHGVMNTDNSTISGETIDYGPCAFMDTYAPTTVFSSIDVQGRYTYVNQPSIAVWNLSRLADTLLPLIDDEEDRGVAKATEVLNGFSSAYFTNWLDGMRSKLGLITEKEGDMELCTDLLKALERQNTDYTLLFRGLSDAALGDDRKIRILLSNEDALDHWLTRWRSRLALESVDINQKIAMMNQTNPIYIPRNHKVEEALDAATWHQDFGPFEVLLELLSSPFERRPGYEIFEQPAPESFGPYRTFCGT